MLKVLLKMVAMATTHSLLRKVFIGLAPTLSALSEKKILPCNEPKFWQLIYLFIAFYKRFLETTSFYTTPIENIIVASGTNFRKMG